MRYYELFFYMAMVLWKRFFTNQNSLPVCPFLSKYLGNRIFSISFIAAHDFLLKYERNQKQTDLIPYLKGFFVLFNSLLSQSQIDFLVYNCMIWGSLQNYTYLVSFWAIILLAPPKSENGAKIYRKCENHAALTTNFLHELGKGWKSQYALGRFFDFLVQMASISVYFILKVKQKFPYHIGVVSTKIYSRSTFFLQGGGRWGFLKFLWWGISEYFSSKKVFKKSNN